MGFGRGEGRLGRNQRGSCRRWSSDHSKQRRRILPRTYRGSMGIGRDKHPFGRNRNRFPEERRKLVRSAVPGEQDRCAALWRLLEGARGIKRKVAQVAGRHGIGLSL